MKKLVFLLICLGLLIVLSFSYASAVEVESGEIDGLCGIALPPEYGSGVTADGWFAFYPTKDTTFLKCMGQLAEGVDPPPVDLRLTPEEVGAETCWYAGMTTGNFFTTIKTDGSVGLVCKFK